MLLCYDVLCVCKSATPDFGWTADGLLNTTDTGSKSQT